MEKKILLIEDDLFIREIYGSEFARAGYRIVASASGEEAIKILQKEQFDLILLDIMLPGINGLEFLKLVKQNHQTKDIKVVLLTNLGHESVIKTGFDLGAIGYLIKSAYNPDQIISEVANFLKDSPLGTKKPVL